jgi:hypothetical protein
MVELRTISLRELMKDKELLLKMYRGEVGNLKVVIEDE